MEEITSMSEIIGLATDKVNLGRQLMNNLKDLLKSGVSGVSKIHKQISREVNNLLIAINEGSISIKSINSSKLPHLECLVKILLKCRALTSVEFELPVTDGSETDPMRVYIVCENGACSVNVEAKNLHTLCNSLNASLGHQRIFNQAEEFVEAATSNPEVPKPPQVCLIFDNELDPTGTGKGGMDESLIEFVNSIVKMDQTELFFNNTNTAEVQAKEQDETRLREQRENKRIQIQQRRGNPIIRSAENSRKRQRISEKQDVVEEMSPIKFESNLASTDGEILEEHSNGDDHDGDGDGNEEDDVYELVQEDARETVVLGNVKYGVANTVAVQETTQGEHEVVYASESLNYFCDMCREAGSTYEQEIVRLREELKQRDSIIKTLKGVIGQGENNSKIITSDMGE